MRVEIWKDFQFDAAHRLSFLPPSHKCYNLHGHTYAVRITLAGEMQGDWLIDFAHISHVWKELCDKQLDHKYLNDVDGLESPTAERLAIWILNRAGVAMPPSVTVASVEVRETPTSGARVTA